MTPEEATQVIWNRNVQAIADAKEELLQVMQERAKVEVEAGRAARRRNPDYPLLNEAEHQRVEQGHGKQQATIQKLEQAKRKFKDGVSQDEIDALIAEEDI